MSLPGILLRSACKKVIQANPPVKGELVFINDTGEFAWLDENSFLNFVILDNRYSTNNIVFKGIDIPSVDLGTNGDKYIQYPDGYSQTNYYTEWTKDNNKWITLNFYRILNKDPLPDEFPEDSDGTLYYIV